MCVTRPVGTRGGCGAGRGPCACLVATRSIGDCVEQTGRTPTRTSTRPPHPLHPTPCPYRTLGRKHLTGYDSPIRSSTFMRAGPCCWSDCLSQLSSEEVIEFIKE